MFVCCFLLAHLAFAVVNPTGKTWSEGELQTGIDGDSWTNLTPGNTPVIAQYGYQPIGTADPSNPNLVHNFNQVLTNAYQGFFAAGGHYEYPHNELPAVSYYAAEYGPADNYGTGLDAGIAFHENGTTLFLSGRGGAYNGSGGLGDNGGETDSIIELNIPTLIKPSDPNDRTGVQTATAAQPWSSVFRHTLTENYGFHSINGLFYDDVTDKLCVQGIVEYDSFPYTQDNMLCYRDPSDLSTSTVDGFYQVKPASGAQIAGTEAAHAATWMADVPSAWQAALGGRVLWGGGKNGSILSRSTVGPSLFAGTLNGLGTNGVLNVTRHMDFWDIDGLQMGAAFFPDRVTNGTSWYQYEMMNCDRDQSSYNCAADGTDSAQVVPWINDFYNIMSYSHLGFIIPGTDTYAVIGQIEGGEDGISYKGTPPYLNGGSFGGSNECPGPCRVQYEDIHNKYWLFDLNDITNAVNSWDIFPYEHGNITFLDEFETVTGARSIMRNATFDLATGRLAVVMSGRSGDPEYSEVDIVIFQDAGWVE